MTGQPARIVTDIQRVESAVGEVPLEMTMTVSRVSVGSVSVDSQ